MRVQDDGTSVYNGITVNTPFEEDNKGVEVGDFLQLMIAQLSNQDFLNPVDDTQYVAQLAQFASMQAMQEMAEYSKTSYVMSLVGKTVTAATYNLGGGVSSETGIVSKVDFSGEETKITVNGKQFTMSQIMTVNSSTGSVVQEDLNAAKDMSVRVNSSTKDKVGLVWEAPVKDADLLSELTYSVYYTDDPNVDFNDITKVKKGTMAGSGIKETKFEIEELEPGTQYYFNVVVRNKAGEESVYQKAVAITEES